jgi:biopolymer transport protein ExbD
MAKKRGGHRASPTIDMTPMVDLAFLLVTFFMLTTKFAPDEPIKVETPTSISTIRIPDTNILTISVAKDGRVFFNMDGKYNRAELLSKMGEIYHVSFTDAERGSFSILPSFGLPVGQLKQYLDLNPDERKQIAQPGIPIDSLHNELAEWVLNARLTNRQLRIAIKGDQDSNFPVMKQIIKTLIERKVNRFNLITNMEKAS